MLEENLRINNILEHEMKVINELTITNEYEKIIRNLLNRIYSAIDLLKAYDSTYAKKAVKILKGGEE